MRREIEVNASREGTSREHCVDFVGVHVGARDEVADQQQSHWCHLVFHVSLYTLNFEQFL